MAYSKLVKPETTELIHLTVVRSERLSEHWMRVTLGGGEIEKFRPMGYDQWFRLFLPIGGDAGLDRVPAKANKMFGYLKFLRIPEGERPVMRNYSVRAYRATTAGTGAELDVDFVLHGSAADGTAGPASRWPETCRPGEHVLIIDEGLTFNPQRGIDRVLLVGDETALPAISSICASLGPDAVGTAIIEVPSDDDALAFPHPSGIEIVWIVRPHDLPPGALALDALARTALPDAPFHAYAAGEQSLASGARKHLVGERGVDKNAVSFCGYWKIGASSPASKAAREAAAEPAHERDGCRDSRAPFGRALSLPHRDPAHVRGARCRRWTYAGAVIVGIVYPLLAWASFDLGSLSIGVRIAFFAITLASCVGATALGILIADRLRRAGVGRRR